MPEIYIDADACPVKDETIKIAGRHDLIVHVVSNGGMRPYRDPSVQLVVVPYGPDAADDWIAEHIAPGDIAITQDIGLAARCLELEAMALRPDGKPFTPESIGMAVAMRDLSAHLRETGEIKGYNKAFSAKDRSSFMQALENAVQAAKRGA